MLSNPSLFSEIASNSDFHARGSIFYDNLENTLLGEINNLHNTKNDVLKVGEIGEIYFPYFSMGNIDSSKLFGIDELILFSFYFVNRKRYSKTLDLGANIGLHTLIMKKLGFSVISYEPDQHHVRQIEKVLNSNNIIDFEIRPRAISNKIGELDFIRILGNTTGSHLLGSKEDIYGDTETFKVKTDDIFEVLSKEKFDLIKMDVEGHEAVLINRISPELIKHTDIMLEVGSDKNAQEIFNNLNSRKIPSYSQKNNWTKVERIEEMPSHHSHGSLFISMQGPPIWKN